MSSYQEKITRYTERKKTKSQSEETEQASEPDSEMEGMLELSGQKLKKAMINMLRDKADSMQGQTGNVSREIGSLRKNLTEMLAMKTTVTQMKEASDGLISRLDTAEERISEREDIAIETSKTEKQRGKKA